MFDNYNPTTFLVALDQALKQEINLRMAQATNMSCTSLSEATFSVG